MNAPEALLIAMALLNGIFFAHNIWWAHCNHRNACANVKNAEANLRDLMLLNEMSKLAGDLHRARMSVYSAVEAHLRAMGED